MTLLIRDATVITMDESGSVHAPGAVLVDGKRIVEVGPSDEVAARAPKECESIDGKGRIALPGFVSAHNHLGYTVFRGRAEDVGHSPTHRLYLPMSMVIRRDEREALGSLAVAELIRGGVTTVFPDGGGRRRARAVHRTLGNPGISRPDDPWTSISSG